MQNILNRPLMTARFVKVYLVDFLKRVSAFPSTGEDTIKFQRLYMKVHHVAIIG